MKSELLAPAGDFEKMVTAIHYGADAVYLGDAQFSLRGKTDSFAPKELRQAVEYAHANSVKAYVTVNIFPHNRDISNIETHLELLREIMPDGVIVSDPGVFTMLKKRVPQIPVHISTQANITNAESAKFWEDMGAKRLVLSRELTINEIADIRRQVKIELEAFVHGAICISYSGRCYISSYLTMRGANRGECTNSCRWNYTLMEEKRPGQYFPVIEDERGSYMMYPKDLCMIEHLPELIGAGVNSFKIEGRMKGINYVGGVVHAYRKALNTIQSGGEFNPAPLIEELAMFSSRGYTTGMYFGKHPDDGYNADGQADKMSHQLAGIVSEVNGNLARVMVRCNINTGDEIEFLSPYLERKRFTIESMLLEDGTQLASAKNDNIVLTKVPDGVRKHDLIRKKR